MTTSTPPNIHDLPRRRQRPLVLGMALLAVIGVGAGQMSLALFTPARHPRAAGRCWEPT